MRSSRWVEFVQKDTHCFALCPSPPKDGGASTDGSVLRFDLGCTTFGDEGGDDGLDGKGDEIVIVEEPGKETVHLGDLDLQSTWRRAMQN